MKRLFVGALFAVAAVLSTAPSLAAGPAAGIASSAGTTVVLNQLFAGLNDTIESARVAGDYISAMAAARAKDVLTEWKRVNSALLDKTFGELDEASRENFGRIRQLIDDLKDPVSNRIEAARQMVDQANLLAETIPVPGSRQVFITRFEPRVLPPQESEQLGIRVRGVNLDKGDPQVVLGGAPVERDLIGPLEARFVVPLSSLPAATATVSVMALPIVYSTPKSGLWAWLTGGREQVRREIPVVVLPKQLATYSLEGQRTVERNETRPFTRIMAGIRGRNERQRHAVHPEPGWTWDLSRPITVRGGRGEAARCERVDMNASSPNAVTIVVSLQEIRELTRWARAWIDCHVDGTLVRTVTDTVPIQPATGSLTWTEDVRLSLPENVKALELKVKTFDGRTRSFSGSDTDKFLAVRREPTSLLLTPRTPDDLIR